MNKRILFITTLNLATNPRLVKEIELAVNNGYEVEVISFIFPESHWSNSSNLTIMKKFSTVHYINIPAGRKKMFNWLLSILFERVFRFTSFFIPLKSKYLSFAVSRRSYLLLKHIHKASKADLVIGHNPGSLYPAWTTAKRMNVACGFDMEDYHPGEGSDSIQKKLILKLMKNILPSLHYISFASSLIKKTTLVSLNAMLIDHAFVVDNYFSLKEFQEPLHIISEKLQMVWFSQNIDINRGLEEILPILSKHHDKVTLTLYGNCNPVFKSQFLDGCKAVEIGGILPQFELHKALSKFEIGLALENMEYDYNRSICLTNKILAYHQAGLYILASNTKAQNIFLESKPDHGVVFESTLHFEDLLLHAYENRAYLMSMRKERYNHARKDNWEKESEKLLATWKRI